MNKALIAVDVQPDFLPGGPLGVPDGDQVVPVLIDMMDDVDVIVLTRDWHPADHISFSDDPTFEDGSWPVHCVEWTPGAGWNPDLLNAAIETGKPVLLVHKGFEQDREAYSGFDGTVAGVFNCPQGDDFRDSTLAQALNALSVNELRIGGLALDYCVKATAIDGRAHYGNTNVYLPATRPVALMTGLLAVSELAAKGVRIKGE